MSSRKELANAIRALSMDAVQKAKSGHPGAPMGMADIAEVLWRDFLKHNPQNPSWADIDEETKRMYLAYYYPFSSPEMVQENTGFEIDVSRAELMEGPSPEIIRLIREEIDPGQAFIKVPKDK